MPCLFFRNVSGSTKFDPESVRRLYLEVADAVKLSVKDVQVHKENTRYIFLQPNGLESLNEHGVHVFVEWNARPQEVKDKVSEAILVFAQANGFARGLDVTFRDAQPGSFYLEGVRD